MPFSAYARPPNCSVDALWLEISAHLASSSPCEQSSVTASVALIVSLEIYSRYNRCAVDVSLRDETETVRSKREFEKNRVKPKLIHREEKSKSERSKERQVVSSANYLPLASRLLFCSQTTF
ncbi:hypothetical protein K0M31_014721, partial [Melipona bicolor]